MDTALSESESKARQVFTAFAAPLFRVQSGAFNPASSATLQQGAVPQAGPDSLLKFEANVRKLQFFISSPGDVCEERALASRVIERLQSEYMGRVALETGVVGARAAGRHRHVPAADRQAVRDGRRHLHSVVAPRHALPAQFLRADGSRYESGTEYEFEEAMEGFRSNGKPDLLVYRRTAPPSVRLDDET